MFTDTRHRGSMGFLTVRQLGKLCAHGAIPRPVCIEHPKFILVFLLGIGLLIFLT